MEFIFALLYAFAVLGLALTMVSGLIYVTHLAMQVERRYGPALNRWIDQKGD